MHTIGLYRSTFQVLLFLKFITISFAFLWLSMVIRRFAIEIIAMNIFSYCAWKFKNEYQISIFFKFYLFDEG